MSFPIWLLLRSLRLGDISIALSRGHYHRPTTLTWVEEFSRFSFIWILFLLWHIADRQGEHFVVDVVREKLSPQGRKRLDVMAHGLALAFAAVVLWASAQFIPTTMLYSTNSFEWLPMGVIYLVIPLGFVMVAIERLRLLLQTLLW